MLVANQQNINLGTIQQGKPYSFRYEITNTSNDKLAITNIVVGCGSCTTASSPVSELEPGAKTDVNVIFTPASTGLQVKKITINYGVHQNLELGFTAQV